MKTFFALLLSCACVCAAQSGVRVTTSTVTNTERGTITTREIFTRDGQTNLVRQTSTKAGVIQVRVHWFYRDGVRLATHVVTLELSAFVPESGTSYSVSLEFSPSKEVRYASIGKNDGYILDAFTCTNGMFYPDEFSHINELNAKYERLTGEPRRK